MRCAGLGLAISFSVKVIFDGVHLPGSPFTVKWLIEKRFDQKHRKLRTALSKLRQDGGVCTLKVRRDHILEDSFAIFQTTNVVNPTHLHYDTQVEFVSEQGCDMGGLTRLALYLFP